MVGKCICNFTSPKPSGMSVSCGVFCTFAVTEHGDLYVFGSNTNGILGTGTLVRDHQPIPYRISHDTVFAGEEVGMVASSNFSNAVVTKEGSLFTWGSVLGLGQGNKHRPLLRNSAPVYIDSATFDESPVIMAACGDFCSIVLTGEGGVWTCGRAQHVGTHTDDDLYHHIPPQQFLGKKIVMVASGASHVLAIDTEGMLWAWGNNIYGQLCCGVLDGMDNVAIPVMVPPATFHGSRVVYVAACAWTTMVVTADGVLWVCGYGGYGQLGTGTTQNAMIPVRVGGSERFGGKGVRMVACSNKHTLIVGTDDRVWACGSTNDFALGIQDTVDLLQPTLLPDMAMFTNGNVATVAAGRKHSVFVMQDGTVYTCGRAMHQHPSGNQSPGGLGCADFQDGNVAIPHPLSSTLFGNSRIGHWHVGSWLMAHPLEGLAVTMGLRDRLGDMCLYNNTSAELIERLLKHNMQFVPTPHKGLLALMGLYDRGL